jgi:hypothetical protein
MPFVKGFLRIRRRRGHPDQGLPGIDEPVDPDYGIPEEGEPPPGVDNELPSPPPGIWPGPHPGHPIVPVPPDMPEEPPPGSIWPKPPGAPSGNFVVIAWIPGHGWKYVVVDPSTWPHPDQGLPAPPTATPKRA